MIAVGTLVLLHHARRQYSFCTGGGGEVNEAGVGGDAQLLDTLRRRRTAKLIEPNAGVVHMTDRGHPPGKSGMAATFGRESAAQIPTRSTKWPNEFGNDSHFLAG